MPRGCPPRPVHRPGVCRADLRVDLHSGL